MLVNNETLAPPAKILFLVYADWAEGPGPIPAGARHRTEFFKEASPNK